MAYIWHSHKRFSGCDRTQLESCCLLERQDAPHLRQQRSFARMEQSVGANLDKAFRQHVRQKAPDEGIHWQRSAFLDPCLAVGVTKRDLVVLHLLDALVA